MSSTDNSIRFAHKASARLRDCAWVLAMMGVFASPVQAIKRNIVELHVIDSSTTKVKTASPMKIKTSAFEFKSILGKQNFKHGFVVYRSRYEYREITSNNDQLGARSLHNLGIVMEYIHPGPKRTQILYVEPGLYSDLSSVDTDDLGLTMRYSNLFHGTGNWSYLLGLGVGRQFGEPQFYPLFGGIYQPSERLLISLTFPAMLTSYQFQPRWNFYSLIRPIGSQWNISNDIPAEFKSANQKGSIDFVATGYHALVGLEYNLTGQFWTSLETGVLLNQSYEFKDQGSTQLSVDLETARTLALALKYKL